MAGIPLIILVYCMSAVAAVDRTYCIIQRRACLQITSFARACTHAAFIKLAHQISTSHTQYSQHMISHILYLSRQICVYAANMPAPGPRLDQFSPSHGMPFTRAAAHPYASQVRLQSTDDIHIQMEPLQTMDSYAGRLMSPGMEVAIYSGRCPLLKLAAYPPPPATHQQACPPPPPLPPESSPPLCFYHFLHNAHKRPADHMPAWQQQTCSIE